MASSRLTWNGFIIRWMVALVLVIATFNPTNYSLFGWIANTSINSDPALKTLLAVVLLIGFIIYLRATMRSIGPLGIGLLVLLFAVFGWVVVVYAGADWLTGDILIWLGLIAVSLIMAVGMAWSHIRRRLSGQVDVDEADIG
ncbi:DUF6524 family protein [Roseospira visakhapatnamensis]|uniref:Uncharacterized protein n=1 Tax=Roseospira visakhapatnamensis TaxID=390880 RepID=A0A7W6RD43_9PROT|nr:DUF6524 family protein [Roseospira visakhapatnamensis]MBB4266335.1 hypothetical protein [Roseospira visakhapatnamensis]